MLTTGLTRKNCPVLRESDNQSTSLIRFFSTCPSEYLALYLVKRLLTLRKELDSSSSDEHMRKSVMYLRMNSRALGVVIRTPPKCRHQEKFPVFQQNRYSHRRTVTNSPVQMRKVNKNILRDVNRLKTIGKNYSSISRRHLPSDL